MKVHHHATKIRFHATKGQNMQILIKPARLAAAIVLHGRVTGATIGQDL
jgi:hypothetical protein